MGRVDWSSGGISTGSRSGRALMPDSISLARISLPKCAGDHLETEKEQNEEKHAPAEARHDGGGGLLIHFRLFLNLLDFVNLIS
jgi:hypothetical protein